MTTKLQHLTNPLKRGAHNLFSANPFRYLHLVEPLMDGNLDSHLESMRKTMQMQEDVFKQQLQELHRIYNLQKKLMQELQIVPKRKSQPIATHETGTGNHNFQVFSSRDDPKEASGSCSGESSKKIPIKFDLERPAESTAPPNIQRNNDDDEDHDDVEVELTLSIGSHCTNRHKRSKSQPSKGDEHGESSSDISRSASSVYQDNNTRPHWLMRDLSLNRT